MTTPDPYHGTDPVVLDPAPMDYPRNSRLRALLAAAAALADEQGASVALAVVTKGGEPHQFAHGGSQRMQLLGALRIVEADILDDTPRDPSDA